MQKYKISKYVRIIKKNKKYTLFNTNNLEIFFADERIAKILQYLKMPHTKDEVFCFYDSKELQDDTKQLFSELLKNEFIVTQQLDESLALKKLTQKYLSQGKKDLGHKSKLNALRVVLTEKCNLEKSLGFPF